MAKKMVALAAASTLAAAELPVTKVVVYKNGVAYYERAGAVGAGEAVRLEFKASEMDDVLKSLVIEERSGGKIRNLRYELSEPLSKRLADLPVALKDQQPLALLLDPLRGARVELKFSGKTVSGSIVSGRMAALAQGAQRQELVLLNDQGEIQVVDLESVLAVRLLDPKLEAALKEALGMHQQSRSRDKRSVTVEADGAKSIQARYLVPAPVWKSSYRLVFKETGDPVLEGWAIVDNASGEDWNKVDLTVVSGKPVSFVTRLYEPKYVNRPGAELAESAAVRPQVFASAAPPPAAPLAAARMMKRAGGRADALEMAVAPAAEMVSSADVAVEASEEGELFEYRFASPVTAKKGESAMIPFLQQPIGARRLTVYTGEGGERNPRAAAELSNNTGKTLDGGPLTIYQGGAYAGEALMATLKASDKRLIDYAVDLGTTVTTNYESGTQAVREIKAVRGILNLRSSLQQTTTYTVANVDEREKTLLIQKRVNADLKLLKPKADEQTAEHYRFQVKVPPKATVKLSVVEEGFITEVVSLSSMTPESLAQFVANKPLSAAGRKQVELIAQRKREFAEADGAVRKAEAESNEIVRDQERIRQNLNSLNRVSGQQEMVQRYVNQLAQGDAQLAQLRDRIAEQRKRATALQTEINALIEKLEF